MRVACLLIATCSPAAAQIANAPSGRTLDIAQLARDLTGLKTMCQKVYGDGSPAAFSSRIQHRLVPERGGDHLFSLLNFPSWHRQWLYAYATQQGSDQIMQFILERYGNEPYDGSPLTSHAPPAQGLAHTYQRLAVIYDGMVRDPFSWVSGTSRSQAASNLAADYAKLIGEIDADLGQIQIPLQGASTQPSPGNDHDPWEDFTATGEK